MFLPMLLLRDSGWWGYAAFAIPNVIGAGAMGWVLRRPSQSTRALGTHRLAIAVFGIVTVAFHAFFFGWIVSSLTSAVGEVPFETRAGWLLPVGAATLLVAGLVAVRAVGPRLSACIVWGISCVVGVLLVRNGLLDVTRTLARAADPAGVPFLAAACAFGFACCPYLDATFHRARASTGTRGGRIAFTVGFGLLFLTMILVTIVYAGFVHDAVMPGPMGTLALPIAGALLVHLMLQSAFTISVHARELASSLRVPLRMFALGCVVIALVAFAAGPRTTGVAPTVGELGYKLFMSCYGLIFPAYVWVCMIPGRDGHAGIAEAAGQRKLVILLIASAMAAPFYWVGWVDGRAAWLVPGVAILLAARPVALALARRTAPAHAPTGGASPDTDPST